MATPLKTMISELVDKLRGTEANVTAPDYTLLYFNRRSRGEVSRMIMAYAGFNWEDKRVTYPEFQTFRDELPFGELPILEVEGQVIAQSLSIQRFLAKRAGLMGTSDVEEAKINMVVDGLDDYRRAMNTIFADRGTDQWEQRRHEVLADLLVRTRQFEALAEGEYFVGNQMTLADISATYIMEFPRDRLQQQLDWNEFPKLRAIREKVYSHPNIAAYVATRPPQRKRD